MEPDCGNKEKEINISSKRKIFVIRKSKRSQNKENSNIFRGRWSSEEHKIFVKACLQFGCNWAKVFIKFSLKIKIIKNKNF